MVKMVWSDSFDFSDFVKGIGTIALLKTLKTVSIHLRSVNALLHYFDHSPFSNHVEIFWSGITNKFSNFFFC